MMNYPSNPLSKPPKLNGHRGTGRRSAFALPPNAPPRWLLRRRGVLILFGALFGIALVYCLHLYQVRETRRRARAELTHLLQTHQSNAAGVIEAFDRSTEDVLFAAAGPYLALAVTVVFLTGQLLAVKQRLGAAERDMRLMYDTMLGLNDISLK